MAYEMGALPVADILAGDVFADDAISFDHIMGTIRITFVTVKAKEPAPPSPYQYVPVGRLVMPKEGAMRLCVQLYDYLKSQGIDPSSVAGGPSEPSGLN